MVSAPPRSIIVNKFSILIGSIVNPSYDIPQNNEQFHFNLKFSIFMNLYYSCGYQQFHLLKILQ